MARVNPRLVFWIAAVHKHPALSPAHRDILTYLAVMRLNFETGNGYCSVPSLAQARGHSESTVRRALMLARTKEPKLLERTRRGHRLGDGQAIASEWKMLYPPIPDSISTVQQRPVETSRDMSADASTVQKRGLNRSGAASQPVTRDRPTGIEGTTDIEAATRRRNALCTKCRSQLIDGESQVCAFCASQPDPPPVADTIAQLRERLQKTRGAVRNSAGLERWFEILAPDLGIVCGTADDHRRMADALHTYGELLTRLDAELDSDQPTERDGHE